MGLDQYFPTLHGGRLHLSKGNQEAFVGVSFWQDGKWQPLPLVAEYQSFKSGSPSLDLDLKIEPSNEDFDYSIRFISSFATRLQIYIEWRPCEPVYHLIPGLCHGDNNRKDDVRGAFPHLAEAGSLPGCSPELEFRADRSAYPLSLLIGRTCVFGVSTNPYSIDDECNEEHGISNGVGASLQVGEDGPVAAVTLSYRNVPWTYLCQTRFEASTGRLILSGETSGRIYARSICGRLDVHSLIQDEYHRLKDFRKRVNGLPPSGWNDIPKAISALRWGLKTAAWDKEREVFSNPGWNWKSQRFDQHSVFGSHEIAWTAGAPCAVPLLQSGLRSKDRLAVSRARQILDRIAQAINPHSGLLYEAVDKNGKPAVGWWAYYNLVADHHYAYLNGQAVYYLLQGYALDKHWKNRRAWLSTSVKVLDAVLKYQLPEGAMPWSLSRSTGKPLDYDGFAGCWFVAAMAMAHRVTGEQRFLRSAKTGLEYYRKSVSEIHCYGTPLDTSKAVDEEGILSYIKAARILHEVTGGEEYLDELRNGLNYELLWRYGYNSNPIAEPYKSAPWLSVGGSLTSVANPHIHPMALMIAGDAAYLNLMQPSSYQESRLQEQVDGALNMLSLMPGHTGFGHYGTLSERACPSDGLLIEHFPDGRESSCWFTHHSWACANILEGLLSFDAGVAQDGIVTDLAFSRS